MKQFARAESVVSLAMRPAAVWVMLVAGTVVSWLLGIDHGLQLTDHAAVGVVVLTIAFVKVWFVGMDFIDLRDAPRWLRISFDAWLALTGCVVVALFLSG